MLYAPTPMHIPDGFLSTLVSILMWLVAVGAIGYSLRRVSRDLHDRQVPLMGVLAAAIFAGQMLNFTVAGGTSGHLLGAALATILVGPWAAVVVMTTVVSIQALVFQDGGLLALGANLFNMAIVGTTVAHFVYTSVRRLAGERSWGLFLGGVAAAWSSIVAAALACALELAVSGTSPANIAVPAMGGIHMLIGTGEALITLGAVAFLSAARRDLFARDAQAPSPGAPVYLIGLAIALLLAVLSPLASAHPDGLEWVAEQNGFLEAARGPIYRLVPDYLFPGISNKALATVVAGVVGTLLVLGVAVGVAYLKRTRTESA
jgi:cobalt/nickel transport system permease protein